MFILCDAFALTRTRRHAFEPLNEAGNKEHVFLGVYSTAYWVYTCVLSLYSLFVCYKFVRFMLSSYLSLLFYFCNVL